MIWSLIEFIFNTIYVLAYTSAILWIIAIIVVINHKYKGKGKKNTKNKGIRKKMR